MSRLPAAADPWDDQPALPQQTPLPASAQPGVTAAPQPPPHKAPSPVVTVASQPQPPPHPAQQAVPTPLLPHGTHVQPQTAPEPPSDRSLTHTPTTIQPDTPHSGQMPTSSTTSQPDMPAPRGLPIPRMPDTHVADPNPRELEATTQHTQLPASSVADLPGVTVTAAAPAVHAVQPPATPSVPTPATTSTTMRIMPQPDPVPSWPDGGDPWDEPLVLPHPLPADPWDEPLVLPQHTSLPPSAPPGVTAAAQPPQHKALPPVVTVAAQLQPPQHPAQQSKPPPPQPPGTQLPCQRVVKAAAPPPQPPRPYHVDTTDNTWHATQDPGTNAVRTEGEVDRLERAGANLESEVAHLRRETERPTMEFEQHTMEADIFEDKHNALKTLVFVQVGVL